MDVPSSRKRSINTAALSPTQPQPDNVINAFRSLLKHTMTTSKRSGVWFRLKREERLFYSLALRLRIRFQSLELMRALVSILKKLKSMGDPAYARLEKGMFLAWAFSAAAVSWGNERARSWRNDRTYFTFLGRLFAPP